MGDAARWALLLGVLGAVFGSHIATVALRWPRPATGRSRCDGCAAALRWWELVPLVSYLAVRGRCRRCGAAISRVHPVVEAAGLGIGLTAGLAAPGVAGIGGAIFGWLLLTLGAIDVLTLRLPNPLTFALALAGLANALLMPPPLLDRMIGGIVGAAVLGGCAAAYRALRGRIGLGGGDPKLFGAIGLWLGWRALPAVLLIACLLGLAIALMLRLRRDARMPFGALLGTAAFAVWLASAAGALSAAA